MIVVDPRFFGESNLCLMLALWISLSPFLVNDQRPTHLHPFLLLFRIPHIPTRGMLGMSTTPTL